MIRFSIFKKSSKFYWSNNRIVHPIIIGTILIYFIRIGIFKTKFGPFDKFLGLLMISAFCLGVVLKLFKLAKPDPLRGKLEGFITFNTDEIIADECIFKLDEIKKIEITNNDYYFKSTGSSRGNFDSNLSNRVDNQLIITPTNGEKKLSYYELYNSDDLQKVRKELINYNLKGKLDFQNLTNLLGITKDKERHEFQSELQRMKSTINKGS